AVAYSIATNNSSSPRTGTISVEDQNLVITQAGRCSFSLGPIISQSFTAKGGTGHINVSSAGDCNWTATSEANCISFSPGGGGGNGAIDYVVAPNTETSSGRGTISVAGQS